MMEDTPQGPDKNAPPPPPPGAPPPPPSSEVVSENRNIMIVLAYLGPLALIPLLVEKDDKQVQWHAKHGLVLFVAWIAVSILLAIVSMIPGVGCITAILWFGLWLAGFIIFILCIVKGLNGQRFLIPGISEFADRF